MEEITLMFTNKAWRFLSVAIIQALGLNADLIDTDKLIYRVRALLDGVYNLNVQSKELAREDDKDKV